MILSYKIIMSKKIISLVISVAMLITIFNLFAFAESTNEQQYDLIEGKFINNKNLEKLIEDYLIFRAQSFEIASNSVNKKEIMIDEKLNYKVKKMKKTD